MRCCARCFGDAGFDRTFPSVSSEQGDCGYCGAEAVVVVSPEKLRDLISPLLRIYIPDDSGRLLVEWMKSDWAMFRHAQLDVMRASSLLAEIVDDGEIVRKKFIPSPDYSTDSLERWEKLKQELKSGNRYFPKTGLNTDRLKELLELLRLPASEVPSKWYRARLVDNQSVLPIEEMGSPPPELATHGRANPAGIPYLYLSSEPSNAVAEIRPYTGESVCIAEFETTEKLSLIDLRSPKQTISPIDFGDEDNIGFLRSDLGFLSKLGEELTRPVKPKAAAIDYVPSQYLCEFIKNCGYEGVVYQSSVGNGVNLALFDAWKANGREVTSHVVGKVSVEFY